MDEIQDLPFEVGQKAEARYFIPGFRGAWFRCKIKDIKRKGHTSLSLEYLDFPVEGIRRTKLFQVPPSNGGKSKERNRVLMVRPCYPPMYNDSDFPDITLISEVTITYDSAFKIGEVVDWWKDDCYWSGKVTKVLANGLLQESENGRMCAKLIQPADKAAEGVVNTKINAVDKGTEALYATEGLSFTQSVSSNNSSKNHRTKEKPKRSLSRTASAEANPPPAPARAPAPAPDTFLPVGTCFIK